MARRRIKGNELKVSIAAVGTSDALAVIQSDQQIASRFEPLHMPRWSASDEMRGFLAAYVKGLPLREPSDVVDQACVNLVLSRSGGVTGRIALILSRAAELSIRKGQEYIDARWIDQASRSLDLATIEPA